MDIVDTAQYTPEWLTYLPGGRPTMSKPSDPEIISDDDLPLYWNQAVDSLTDAGYSEAMAEQIINNFYKVEKLGGQRMLMSEIATPDWEEGVPDARAEEPEGEDDQTPSASEETSHGQTVSDLTDDEGDFSTPDKPDVDPEEADVNEEVVEELREFHTKMDEVEVGEPTGKKFKNLDILEPTDHPAFEKIVESVEGLEYKERELGNTSMLDTEMLTWTLDRGYNPRLIGKTGTGKDTLVDWVLFNTHRPGIHVNFGLDTTYEKLVGMWAPGEDGWEWIDGILKYCVENGIVFIADEVNAVTGDATMALHQITDTNAPRLVVEELGEVIKPHPQFLFIATMNPETYSGANTMNPAFKRRFFPMQIPYLEPPQEKELIEERTGLARDSTDMNNLVGLANSLRSGATDQGKGQAIKTDISTDDLVQIADLGEEIHDVGTAAKYVLEGLVSPAEKNAVVSQVKLEFGFE